jgi:hypothetical protein
MSASDRLDDRAEFPALALIETPPMSEGGRPSAEREESKT